ncbi:MAG: 5'/3'-nucleotidase SurE [bacterium]
MKILLTNDDGYRAEGIRELARALAPRAEVVIVAPERQRSAASHAVTLHKPLRLNRARESEEKNVAVWYSNGTPTDCTMLGLFEVAPDAGLVISGINSGPNLGEDVLYSGTVAGAMEAALLGKPAIAVSLSRYNVGEYGLARAFMAGLAPQIAESGLPGSAILNINVPPVAGDQYRGFRVTALGTRTYRDVLDKRTDPRGQSYYWITGTLVPGETKNSGTDYRAVSEGLVSITPINLDMTHTGLLESLRIKDPLGGTP